ncbi:MAG: DUF4394 domain-containing protein [Burkholderiaceae bacterium]|nr:DUF4394 domain-containing protein [Burkholderiaceae bacterium]
MIRLTQGAVLGAALSLACIGAQAVTLVGLTSANQIVRFDTAAMGMEMPMAITGLSMAGERLVGIDNRPGDGMIYGVSTANKIYTVNEMTGVATWKADLNLAVIDPGRGYGIDFNPVADFNGAASLRLVSTSGENFAINANTGVVGNAANMIAAGYSAVAYTNSMTMPSMAPAGTALYYIDSSNDRLAMAPGAFNSPTIMNLGMLGVDVLKANGFEISGGLGYAALNVDGASLDTGIYSINLMTGAATMIGAYNGTLSGLTVSAVPEPQTYAMLLAGLMGLGFVARRRAR